ncbi:MAG: FtsX-like permease family protein [Kiritimatiellia bacterium]
MLRGLKRGKARFLCAATGVAAATAAVVFMFSLAATTRAQAPALAKRAVVPWAAWRLEGAFGFRGRRDAPPDGRAAPDGRVAPDGRATPPDRRAGPPNGRTAPDGRAAPPDRRAGPPNGRPKAPPRDGAGRPDLTLPLIGLSLDYRPGGRVLQGPPMRVVLTAAPAACPYGATKLKEGRWVDDGAADREVVCTVTALKRFGRGDVPPVGTELKFVGRAGTMTARIVGYLEEARLPPGWPCVFANRPAFAALKGETQGLLSLWRRMPPAGDPATFLTPDSGPVVAAFAGDEVRRLDYARPLLLIASALMALSLLVNSLLLSVEANRPLLAVLRTLGLTRGGVAGLVLAESLCATGAGFLAGCALAIGGLTLYVAADPVAFPTGATVAWGTAGTAFAVGLAVAFLAVLFALSPALSVRPLDVRTARSRSRRRGMAVVFALGFGAFAAVEVWGASLMRGFVPSPQWPDAIVSILPGGVSAFDIEKLRGLPGVKRISELLPLQLDYDPVEADSARNALFLAAEWIPAFRYLEGTRAAAEEAVATSGACVISEMMSRARNLHVGDRLRVTMGGGRARAEPTSLPIAGVVDVNWHMVTSRGLVRGLNGASPMTDGPVFVSFDTLESLDARPAVHVRMTHLWVEYEPGFLKRHGVFPAGRLIEKAIDAALGHPVESTVRLHARDEIADGTLAHGDDVIGQVARVPFAFLLILSIGFIAMLVAEADADRRSLAILRAVGATRLQLAGRLAVRALRTAFWGVVFGLPLGALVGWVFAGHTGNWPGMPHYFAVPVRIVLEGAALSLAVVLLVAVGTSLSLVSHAVRSGLGRSS